MSNEAKTDLRNRPLHIPHNQIDNLWDHHNEIISTKIVYGKAINQASRPGSHVKRGIMIEKGIHLLKNLPVFGSLRLKSTPFMRFIPQTTDLREC